MDTLTDPSTTRGAWVGSSPGSALRRTGPPSSQRSRCQTLDRGRIQVLCDQEVR